MWRIRKTKKFKRIWPLLATGLPSIILLLATLAPFVPKANAASVHYIYFQDPLVTSATDICEASTDSAQACYDWAAKNNVNIATPAGVFVYSNASELNLGGTFDLVGSPASGSPQYGGQLNINGSDCGKGTFTVRQNHGFVNVGNVSGIGDQPAIRQNGKNGEPGSFCKATSSSTTGAPTISSTAPKPVTCSGSDCATTDTGGQTTTTTPTTNTVTCSDNSVVATQSDCANTSTTTTCETSSSPLTWILCPVFNMASDFSQWALKSVVQPFLITSPVSTNPSNSSFKTWSDFRIYGNIVLVIALLVIVFGEVIGGGVIDVYTAKKMLPRILVAAILINLSVYAVALMVDISNVLGQGISDLIIEPFKSNGLLNFSLNATQQTGVFGVGILGLVLSGTAVSGLIFGIIAGGGGAFLGVALEAGLFLVLPLILGAIGVLLTLIFRQGLILFLIIASPVAFALYCLPNTEQYFKKWWKLFMETLMIYPIIMGLFAIADVLSMTILQANSVTPANIEAGGAALTGSRQVIATIIAFMLQFIPLFAAPFAFKIAGGLLGQINEAIATGAKQVNKLADTRRAQVNRRYGSGALQGRQRRYEHLQEVRSDTTKGRFRKGLAGFEARRISGFNLEHAMSIQRAEWGKEINDQIATGKDDEIRGLTVNKAWADTQAQSFKRADGTWSDGAWRIDDKGKKQYKSLGGAWVDEADVDAGRGRWGRNTFAQQAALSYEMRKANSEPDLQNIATNYHTIATNPGGWNMNEGQAQGAWIGAAFERQNEHLEYKHTDWKTGNLSKSRDFVNEVYEKKGSYPLAQMSSNTVEQLKNAHAMAVASGDVDQQNKIAAIAETFMHEYGGVGVGSGQEEIDRATGQPTGRRIASTPGAAHTAERVRELAKLTGVYDIAPTGLHVPVHAPTPNRREQS